jgi:hypothetical protein
MENMHGIAERLNISIDAIRFPIAVPDSQGPAGLWFDELIRVADYFAGTLAAWNTKANFVPKVKYARMLREVIADASNVAILKLRIGDDGMLVRQRQITLKPSIPALKCRHLTIRISRSRLAREADRMFKLHPEHRIHRVHKAEAKLIAIAEQNPLATEVASRSVKHAAAIVLSQGITRVE